jgi:hypothetical protein
MVPGYSLAPRVDFYTISAGPRDQNCRSKTFVIRILE